MAHDFASGAGRCAGHSLRDRASTRKHPVPAMQFNDMRGRLTPRGRLPATHLHHAALLPLMLQRVHRSRRAGSPTSDREKRRQPMTIDERSG
jgi:hypothetical protein